MNYKFNWSTFPKYTFKLSSFATPAEIMHYFAHRNIDKYVYCVKFKGIIIKFGMSAAESDSRLPGERVYRQLAHCFSWGDGIRIDGSSGADWLIIERDFKNLYGIDLDHQHISVIVWDVTNYDFQGFRPKDEVEAMESELINNYLEEFEEKPIGNINDEANKRNRPFVNKRQFNACFSYIS